MLSKLIKLEDIYDDYMNPSMPGDSYIIGQFMQITIEILKDTLAGQVKLLAEIDKLEKKVKQLEQQQTYYPFSEEELLKEPVGGTD